MSIIPFGFWGGVNEITFTTGLKGARFNGYFADDVYWFNTATPHGDVQNNVTSISSFSSNADFYSWRWFGYFLAPETGVYTFYTASDDASYLWIGNNALGNNFTVGNALVNNGGLHGVVEKSGTVTLQANTYYALRIQFGENGGGDIMTVSFQGPGIAKTTNGAGYFFGGQEAYAGNWIGGEVPRFDEEEENGGGENIVTDQLICHLDSRDPNSYPGGGTTWLDLSGNGTHASLTAAFWTGPFQGHPGFMDMNRSATAYADLTLPGIDATTPVVTVEMWVRPYDMGATTGMFFGFTVYDLYHTSSGLGFNTGGGDMRGAYLSRLRNEDWWFGQWHHVVVVMHQTSSYTNNKIYINGKLYDSPEQISGSEQTGNRSFSNGQMRISGWRNNTAYPYEMDVTVFRVYKKELTAEEVLQNFNLDRQQTYFNKKAVKNVPMSGLKLYFDFEGENNWYTSNGSYVRDFSPAIQYGGLFGGVGWNSGNGGHMQFRSANQRYITLNKASNWFGLYYGSASFVFVVRAIDMNFAEYILHHQTTRNYGADVNIQIGGAKITYSHNTANPPDTFASFGAMSANTWYHVVCTYNFNNYQVQIYVNGTLYVTNGLQERMIGLGQYYLGRDHQNGYYTFDLGLFMIYNRVISGSEVTTLFNEHRTRFGL